MSIFRFAQFVSLSAMVASLTLYCPASSQTVVAPEPSQDIQPYLGLWVSSDQSVQQRLLPNSRYEESHGLTTYRGTYRVRGEHIEFWDDSGFVADGDFLDGALHQSGLTLVRTQL